MQHIAQALKTTENAKRVYAALYGSEPTHLSIGRSVSRLTIAKHLIEMVERGKLTESQITQAIAQVNGGESAPADDAAAKSAAAAASRAEQLALDAHALVKKLAKEMSAIPRAEPVDRADISARIGQAVAEGFSAFKREVVAAGAEQAVADAVAVHITHRAPAVDVFGVDVRDRAGNPLMVDIWNHPEAPAVDPNFVWSDLTVRHLLVNQATPNLWFGGERGTGKTETARQFAARTGRAFKRINFHKHSAVEEYIGATALVDGRTEFAPGDFLTAYTCPGSVILLDEVTNASPGELAPLNGLLECGAAVSIGGKAWRRAQGVAVIAADNTLGNGDESGRYAGTQSMNSALVDRFERVVHFEFMSADAETAAVVNHTNMDEALVRHVIAAINVARGKVETGDIVDAPSIRSVVAFLRALHVLTPAEAWATAVINRQPSESKAALEAVYQACINEALIAERLTASTKSV